MSRGLGHVERSIRALMDSQPTIAFTVEGVAKHVYPEATVIEKKHRVSVLRALGKLPGCESRVVKLKRPARALEPDAATDDDDGRLVHEYRPSLTPEQQEDFIAMWDWACEHHHFDERPEGTKMEFGPAFLGHRMVDWMHQPDELIEAMRLTQIVTLHRRFEDEYRVSMGDMPEWDKGDLLVQYNAIAKEREARWMAERETAANSPTPKKSRRR